MFNIVRKFLKFILLKIKFSHKCKFDFSCDIVFNSNFEGMNKLGHNVFFSGSLGFGSYVSKNSFIIGKIGRFCSIANNVTTSIGTHPYLAPFVSSSPCFFSMAKQNGGTFADKQIFDEFRYADKEKKYGIIIENDVWVCEGVFINPGIRISNGAVILAHAVVTKDVPPYAIVGGVPAKVLKYRYDEDTIKVLLESKWWQNDEQWFKSNWKIMNDIESFKKAMVKI